MLVHVLCKPQCSWWKELQQHIHYDAIEGDVWHHDPNIQDQNYREAYRIVFLSIQYLVYGIETWMMSNVLMFVWESLPIHKVVGLVIYRLVHDRVPTL